MIIINTKEPCSFGIIFDLMNFSKMKYMLYQTLTLQRIDGYTLFYKINRNFENVLGHTNL